MNEEPDADDAEDLLYISEFNSHLSNFQAHLAGVIDDGKDLRPSFIAPTGFWTPAEKDTFFHSLRVYSRLRPDLIADSLGTKTAIDVCVYIDALDEALSLGKHPPLHHLGLNVPVDVSDDWVRREEQMAQELVSLEYHWEQQDLSLIREKEISSHKTLLSATAMDGGTRAEDAEVWEQDKRKHWDQEDLLNHLEHHHLRVMERILLQEERFRAIDSNNTSPEDQQSIEPIPTPALPSATQSSGRAAHPLDDAMVDRHSSASIVPELSFEGGTQGTPVPLPRISDSSHDHPPHRATFPPPSPPLTPLAAQQTTSSGQNPEHDQRNAAVNLSNLSPLTRRRFAKRLYMRRKRAAMRGEEAPVVVTKLRPGRRKVQKRELRQPLNPRGVNSHSDSESLNADPDRGDTTTGVSLCAQGCSSSVVATTGGKHLESGHDKDGDAGMITDDRGPDNATTKNSHPSGMTKPYRIQNEFGMKGIDARTLTDGNLGFFHVSTLGRLMNMFKSGYDVQNSDSATIISASTIRYLTTIVRDFIAEVIQRSIILREQQNKIRSGTKAHRLPLTEISPDNVHRALLMMGVKDRSKKSYFAGLLDEEYDTDEDLDEEESFRADTPESEDGDDKERVDDDVGAEDEDSEVEGEATNSSLRLPLHREIHLPLVHLPKSLTQFESSLGEDEELMPEDTDEEALQEELEDEMRLDEADREQSSSYEADLWRRFGNGRTRRRKR